MHFLIGLGILAGLVWFAFGAGTARAIVGVVLLAIVAFFAIVAAMVIWPEGPPGSPSYKAAHQPQPALQVVPKSTQPQEQFREDERIGSKVWWAKHPEEVEEVEREIAAAAFNAKPMQHLGLLVSADSDAAKTLQQECHNYGSLGDATFEACVNRIIKRGFVIREGIK